MELFGITLFKKRQGHLILFYYHSDCYEVTIAFLGQNILEERNSWYSSQNSSREESVSIMENEQDVRCCQLCLFFRQSWWRYWKPIAVWTKVLYFTYSIGKKSVKNTFLDG